MRTLFILFLLYSIQTTGQTEYNTWKEAPTKDKFGDETGKSGNTFLAEGTFSNSAVTNEQMIVNMTHLPDNAVLIGFYPYKRKDIARFKANNDGVISIKREDGTVEEYEGETFALGLYFLKDTPFYNLVTNGNGEKLKVYIRVKNFDKYSNSEYIFSFTTQNSENDSKNISEN